MIKAGRPYVPDQEIKLIFDAADQIVEKESTLTDRTESIQKFSDEFSKIKAVKDNEIISVPSISILNYSGVSGIGKTYLTDHIKLLMDHEIEKEKSQGVINNSAYISYSFVMGDDCASVLYKWSKLLRSAYGMTFEMPVFAYAMLKYEKLISEGKKLSKSNLKSVSGRMVEMYGLMTMDADEITAKLFVDKLLGNLEPLAAVFRYLKKKSVRELRRYFNEIDRMTSAEQLCKMIPKYFARDLSAYRYEHMKNSVLVMILDDFQNVSSPLTNPRNSEWLTEDESVIKTVPKTLWVFNSHDSLGWPKDTGLEVQKDILSYFNEDQTKDYLIKRSDLFDDRLIDHIFKCSGGLPELLKLYANQFCFLVEKNPKKVPDIKDIGVSTSALTDALLDDFTANQIEILEVMACLYIPYTEGILKKICSELEINAKPKDLKRIVGSQLVKPSKDFCQLQDFVKLLIQAHMYPATRVSEINKAIDTFLSNNKNYLRKELSK